MTEDRPAIVRFTAPILAAFLWGGNLYSAAEAAGLRRFDFLVKGSSCAACLIRLEKRLRCAPGVVKATVSIYKPFAAVVIIDPAKCSRKEIVRVLALEKTRPEPIMEEEIATVPLLLTPKALPLKAGGQ